MTALPDHSMNVYLAHGAEASLSMADANLKGVKHFDPNKIDPQNQIITIGVCVVAATSLLTGLFAMYAEASIIAYLAFAFPLITGPMVISQRRKIQWIPSKYSTSAALFCTLTGLHSQRAVHAHAHAHIGALHFRFSLQPFKKNVTRCD